MIAALLAGLIAGLAVALPVGPVGVYLLSVSARNPVRPVIAAACGIAVVDGGYAVLAAAAGTSATRIAAIGPWLRVAAALVLVGLAISLLLPAADSASPAAGQVGPIFLRFVALTALNPTTVVYFVALVIGLRTTGLDAVLPFAVGVFVGSGLWQLTLVALGRLIGRLGLSTRRLRQLSALVMLGLAARALLD